MFATPTMAMAKTIPTCISCSKMMYSLEQRKEPKLKAKMYPPVTPVLGAKNEKYSSAIQTYGHQTCVFNGT